MALGRLPMHPTHRAPRTLPFPLQEFQRITTSPFAFKGPILIIGCEIGVNSSTSCNPTGFNAPEFYKAASGPTLYASLPYGFVVCGGSHCRVREVHSVSPLDPQSTPFPRMLCFSVA